MKVWAVRTAEKEGPRGPAKAQITVPQATKLGLLDELEFRGSLDGHPEFPRGEHECARVDDVRDAAITVLEMSDQEAREAGRTEGAGFYRSCVPWKEAEARLKALSPTSEQRDDKRNAGTAR